VTYDFLDVWIALFLSLIAVNDHFHVVREFFEPPLLKGNRMRTKDHTLNILDFALPI
jgi:hypothetical protein